MNRLRLKKKPEFKANYRLKIFYSNQLFNSITVITNLVGVIFLSQYVSNLVPPSSMGVPIICKLFR